MSKYVINKEYNFELVADGPRPSGVGSTSIQVRLTHDEAMQMGEDFIEEEPCGIWDNDYGIKDVLDEKAAKERAQELFEEWQDEYDEDDEDEEEKTLEDFYDQAWEWLGECYFCWDQSLVEDCIEYYKEQSKPDEQERIKIAQAAISAVSDMTFSCFFHASEGGTCGDSWTGDGKYYLSRAELLYLINESTEIKDLLKENDNLTKVDVESDLDSMAYDAAFPDGMDEEFEEWGYGGECEELDGYIAAWRDLLSMIYDGDITEEELDEWLEYFCDNDNFEYEIEEWHKDY